MSYMADFPFISSGMFFMDYMADGLYGRKKPILGQFFKTMTYMAGHISHYPLYHSYCIEN